MYEHQNLTTNQKGISIAAEAPPHLRCPHCTNSGMVCLDAPHSAALPCPGCTYGRARGAKWLVKVGVHVEVTPSHYRGVSWENGCTLEHTATCNAPADARNHPEGYRCRRPARPSTGGRQPLCDTHAAGTIDAPTEQAAAYVATAKSRHVEWEAQRDARREREDVA